MSDFRYISVERQPQSLLGRIVALVVAGLVLVGSLFIGVFLFVAFFAFFALAALVIYGRMWWLKRQYAANGGAAGYGGSAYQNADRNQGRSSGDVLDAEYTVVDEQRDDSQKDDRQ